MRRIVDTVTKSVGAQADAEALIRLLYAFVDADSFGSLIRVDADAVAALASALRRWKTVRLIFMPATTSPRSTPWYAKLMLLSITSITLSSPTPLPR